jgi:hypothetical protein
MKLLLIFATAFPTFLAVRGWSFTYGNPPTTDSDDNDFSQDCKDVDHHPAGTKYDWLPVSVEDHGCKLSTFLDANCVGISGFLEKETHRKSRKRIGSYSVQCEFLPAPAPGPTP